MSETPTSDGGPVFRLIYRSHSLIDPADRTSALGDIFATARRNNSGREITGALMITDATFVQALEGDEERVRELFAAIEQDARHGDVTLLEETEAPRTFGRWAMARVADDGGPDIRLMSNAGRREIVEAPRDPSVTDEQEAVLGYMRDAAADPTLGGEQVS